jgi:1-acyl-sn-glycerol-3-phosphate acyltransferase
MTIRTAERAKFASMRLIARILRGDRLEVYAVGTEHLPLDGPALVIARHYHHLFDGLALFAAIARPMHILVSADWVQTKAGRWVFESLARSARWPAILREQNILSNGGPMPLQGKTVFSVEDVARYRRQALRESVQLLLEGRLLVVFPEGFPNIDPHFTPKSEPEQFIRFRSGFAAIAAAAEKRLRAAVPLVPAGLRYKLGKRSIVYLRFGSRSMEIALIRGLSWLRTSRVRSGNFLLARQRTRASCEWGELA